MLLNCSRLNPQQPPTYVIASSWISAIKLSFPPGYGCLWHPSMVWPSATASWYAPAVSASYATCARSWLPRPSSSWSAHVTSYSTTVASPWHPHYDPHCPFPAYAATSSSFPSAFEQHQRIPTVPRPFYPAAQSDRDQKAGRDGGQLRIAKEACPPTVHRSDTHGFTHDDKWSDTIGAHRE